MNVAEPLAPAPLRSMSPRTAQRRGSTRSCGALGETKPIVDMRLRTESVDQDGMVDERDANTLRCALGFETGKAWNTACSPKATASCRLTGDYNSTTQRSRQTTYPVVADPETYEINRLQLTNTRSRHHAHAGPPAHRARRPALRRQRRLAPERADVRRGARRQPSDRELVTGRHVLRPGEPRVRRRLAAGRLRRRQRRCERRRTDAGRQAHGVRLLLDFENTWAAGRGA